MSIIGNRGFARFRKEILISVAALAVVTAASVNASPASAMGRSFGGGGHAMGGQSFGGHSMGGGFGGHSSGGFNRSMGGVGHATGGVTRSTGGLSRSTGGLSHARTNVGHATASHSNALASSHNTARQPVESHGSNAAARQPAGVNKPVEANNANRPSDKVAQGRKTDDGGMSFRPGTEKKNGERFNKTVDIERDYDTGRRRQWTFNDDGTVVETLTGTVSYGVTQATGVVRVDDLPHIKKKVQNDCSLLAAKVAALSKQLAWEQGVLAALGGAQNVKLSGTTSGVATSFDDPADQQAAIARMEKQMGITGQLLAMYTADLNRCLAANAAAAAADGE